MKFKIGEIVSAANGYFKHGIIMQMPIVANGRYWVCDLVKQYNYLFKEHELKKLADPNDIMKDLV